MNAMEFVIWFAVIGLSFSMLLFIVGIIVIDIRHQRQNKREQELLKMCIKEKGIKFTKDVIDITGNTNLNLIDALEQALNIKQQN